MRTLVQLDVQNLFFSAKDIDKRIDFLKIKEHFDKNGDEIVGLFAYIIRTPDAEHKKFESLLKNLGYTLRIKKASIGYKSDGQRIYKGTDQDIAICIDCMKMAEQFDKWVLMSGDGDFIDLCKHLKDSGKFVEVWSMKGISFNKGFCDYADVIHFLNRNFFYDKKNSRGRDSTNA
ncbi:MAG: NYN domain-containing protein [Candidatus Altiarchaeales archaeon]|nr:NYN domain-containing protein [Candidatus Altiarchaeales archaeon]